jgi:signal transduction histidine kinase
VKNVLLSVAAVLGVYALVRKRKGSDEGERVFRELLTGLTADPTPEAMLNRVAERAATLVGADSVYVERLDAERQEIIATAVHGEGLPGVGTRGPYRGSVAAQAIEAGSPVFIADVRKENRSILGLLDQPFPAVALPLRSEGEAIGVLIVIRRLPSLTKKDIERLGVFVDAAAISMRRLLLLERLEQALRSKEELLRVLVHDLRNPVNTISFAAASILNNGPSPDSLSKLRDIIKRSTARMNRLIQDLLDQAVIERSGFISIHLQPNDSQAITEEVCDIARVHAKTKAVQVASDIRDNATLFVDRGRLLQVLVNLIDNALKFTPDGGRIVIKSESTVNNVRFSVFNSGEAIPEAYCQKIFDPYFQVPGNTKGGAGLGLTIARRIVEQHGGTIWVESKEGEGTTFFFTIPAQRAAA